MSITMLVSADGGKTYNIPVRTVAGAHGPNVAPGQDLRIEWNAGADWPGKFSDQCRVRLIADDGSAGPAPLDMVLIPGGTFTMGDNSLDNATPAQEIHVSPFFMDKYEVHEQLWSTVVEWGTSHGYTSLNASARGEFHPVHSVSWYAAVKWCNARSEKEGLTPVYYSNLAQTTVYRQGNTDLSAGMVRWAANGYRLPTEAEWERAARGGLQGKKYPWGDTLTGANANFWGSGDAFDSQMPGTTPVGYYNGRQTPAGADMANGFGLYDMTGNVMEWCWDWFGSYYSEASTQIKMNPTGPKTATGARVLRGGAWRSSSYNGQIIFLPSAFHWGYTPAPTGQIFDWDTIGFRCVRAL